jgi:hypothetical protein
MQLQIFTIAVAAARNREVSCLDAHKREVPSRSMRRSLIMRDKTDGKPFERD